MSRRNSIIKMEFDHLRYEPNTSVSDIIFWILDSLLFHCYSKGS